MKQIDDPNSFLAGKVISRVDTIADNCSWFFFMDHTIVCIEAENVGYVHGPVYYEATLEEYLTGTTPQGA